MKPCAPGGFGRAIEVNKWLGEHTINVPPMPYVDGKSTDWMEKVSDEQYRRIL